MTENAPLRVAVIGAGFAGQAHAFGYRNASMAPDLAWQKIELATIVDANLDLARQVAARYGFAYATSEIENVLDDPSIDAVSVALPNGLHMEILPRVFSSGKHVLAEKPLGRNAREAAAIAGAAKGSVSVVGVGFSFRRLPALATLCQIARSGSLGDIWTIDAWYHADYASDPTTPFAWRYSKEQSGAGALIDIGTHVLDAVMFVGGPIKQINSCVLRTVIANRLDLSTGTSRAVDNDDIALLTLELESGTSAQVRVSRVATGTPNSLGIEVRGSQGFARFDSMIGNEVFVFERSQTDNLNNGVRRVVMGPNHPYFSDVVPMPSGGVGSGYGEAFIAEVQEFLRCVIGGQPMDTDLSAACRVMVAVDAALLSATTGRPVLVADVKQDFAAY